MWRLSTCSQEQIALCSTNLLFSIHCRTLLDKEQIKPAVHGGALCRGMHDLMSQERRSRERRVLLTPLTRETQEETPDWQGGASI